MTHEELQAEIERLRTENSRLKLALDATELQRDVWAKKAKELGAEINDLLDICRAIRKQHEAFLAPPVRRGRSRKAMKK